MSCFSGFISGGATSIIFAIDLPKEVTKVSGVEILSGTAEVRGVKGYIEGSNNTPLSLGSNITLYKPNKIQINIGKSSEFTNTTNNTPINVRLKSNLKIRFT